MNTKGINNALLSGFPKTEIKEAKILPSIAPIHIPITKKDRNFIGRYSANVFITKGFVIPSKFPIKKFNTHIK